MFYGIVLAQMIDCICTSTYSLYIYADISATSVALTGTGQ